MECKCFNWRSQGATHAGKSACHQAHTASPMSREKKGMEIFWRNDYVQIVFHWHGRYTIFNSEYWFITK